MSAVHNFLPGDFLIFQLESGYALLRVLDVENSGGEHIWHLASYEDLFLDPESAEAALEDHRRLRIGRPHVALTNRAFESTQVAKMKSAPLADSDLEAYRSWKSSGEQEVSDRSIRLLLGLR